MRRLALQAIEIEDIEEEDAVSLLLQTAFLDSSSVEMRQAAKLIVVELCCLPLAVDQAGAAIASGLCTIHDYLEMYIDHRAHLMDLPVFKAESTKRQAAYSSWDLSFDSIRSKADKMSSSPGARMHQSAIAVLHIFAFLHYDGIAEEIFRRAAVSNYMISDSEDVAKPDSDQIRQLLQCKGQTWNNFLFRQGIRILMSFSLIKKPTSFDIYRVHPLVHRWSRDRLSEHEKRTICAIAGSLLAASIAHHGSKEYMFHRTLVPHIIACLQHLMDTTDDPTAHIEDQSRFAIVLHENGLHRQAAELLRQAWENQTNILGAEHPDTVTSMGNLATTYSALGRHREAEDLEERVLEIRTRILGAEHPDLLASMSNLTLTYFYLGRHREAEELEKQALEIRTRILGGEHPYTLISANNLALTYSALGRHQEAEKLKEHVLEIRTRIIGAEHPDTLISMNNLAQTYWNLGKLLEAEGLQTQVLEVRTRILGEEHLHTLLAMNDLSVIYSSLGKDVEAEELRERAQGIRERVAERDASLGEAQ